MYIFQKKCGEQTNFLHILPMLVPSGAPLEKSFNYAPADAPAISAAKQFFPGNYENNVHIHPVQ